MKTGVELISKERWNQVYNKGYDLDHDAGHDNGELAKNASILIFEDEENDDWDLITKDRIRNLSIAGALIAAEIDRLQNLNK